MRGQFIIFIWFVLLKAKQKILLKNRIPLIINAKPADSMEEVF